MDNAKERQYQETLRQAAAQIKELVEKVEALETQERVRLATPSREDSYKQALQKATTTIRELLEANEALQVTARQAKEPIALVGMGCRFPGGANNPEQFWALLRDGVDAVRDVPPERWPAEAYYEMDPAAPGKMYTVQGGFLDTPVDHFDASFFGISPREARALDPQHRLLLETSWEALEYGCLDPMKLRNSKTAVFVGMSSDDYAQAHRHSGDLERIDAYSITGTTFSTAVGRLSYTFGWQGPCMALDTACSSSLVSLHLACHSLWSGEADLALAGGVNLILAPELHICFSKLQAISPEGRCKTFDASADGYVRGEGCGIVVLKRLRDAQRDGNRILAVVRGSAINQDGKTNGLAAPNGHAQQAVIRQALEIAGVHPSEVDYVEAHGTGTVLGDPIEVEALGAVLGRARQAPLWLGSVKTNIGHLEPAAGVAGLIKTVLAFMHEELPPSLHFRDPNPYIAWTTLPIRVIAERQPWKRSARRRIAGLSSFGFSGTNAHVVLEESPDVSPQIARKALGPYLLSVSARDASALRDLAHAYLDRLAGPDAVDLKDLCYSAHLGRSHWTHRLSVVGDDNAEISQRLSQFLAGQPGPGVAMGCLEEGVVPELAFLFIGQGSQYPGMGRDLYEHEAVFKAAIDRCDALLQPLLGQSLIHLLWASEASTLNQTGFAQPALFALEYALYQLWDSWGVTPSAVMGHSVGEYVAACVAGVFGLEDGLRLIAARGQLMQALPSGGSMAAVLAPQTQVTAALAPYVGRVEIAALNGPEHVVISGESMSVQAVCDALARDGVRTTPLAVSHAFHSHLMEPMLMAFERVARRIAFSSPTIKLISNLTGDQIGSEIASPDYWIDHIRRPVVFATGMETLWRQGMRLFVELGPKPTLLGMGRQCLLEAEGWVPSLREQVPAQQQMYRALGELYVRGVLVDWAGLYPGENGQWTTLPSYPFQSKRYWLPEHGVSLGRSPVSPSRLVTLLNEGKTVELVHDLEASGELASEDMHVLPKLAEWLIRQHRESFEDLAGLGYRLEWQTKARRVESLSVDTFGTWLVFADSDTSEFIRWLHSTGQRFILVLPGDAYIQTAPRTWSLDVETESDYRRLLAEVSVEERLAGVVYMWTPPVTPLSATQALGDAGLSRVLFLTRALAARDNPPCLWLVTQGATRAGLTTLASPFPAMLWGMGRSLFLEYPELKGGVIDLSPSPTSSEWHAVWQELWDSEGEDGLALRDGERYVARLAACQPVETIGLRFEREGAYLITGGLGALGLQVARFLAESGAGHLVLMGRRGASTSARETLSRLDQYGTSVTVVQADSTDEIAVRKVLKDIDTRGFQLKGVVHAAGVFEFRPVCDLDSECLQAVLAPKLQGGWALHRATQDIDLDFFVCFSSISSMLGTAHQTHYTAANGFLDGLAEYRRGCGMPALTINWGPWQGGGMADGDAGRRTAEAGFRAVSPRRALAMMGRLLRSGDSRAIVVEADWTRLKSVYEVRGKYPLLELLGDVTGEVERVEAAPIREALQALTDRDCFDYLVAYLQERVAEVLYLEAEERPDPRRGFFDMGMDSIIAVELKSRIEAQIGHALAPSVVFDYPTIEALAGYLLQLIAPTQEPARESLAQPPLHTSEIHVEPAVANDDVYQLSDLQIAELIDDELESLLDDKG